MLHIIVYMMDVIINDNNSMALIGKQSELIDGKNGRFSRTN